MQFIGSEANLKLEQFPRDATTSLDHCWQFDTESIPVKKNETNTPHLLQSLIDGDGCLFPFEWQGKTDIQMYNVQGSKVGGSSCPIHFLVDPIGSLLALPCNKKICAYYSNIGNIQ